jgi:hypothetical protein
MPIDPEIARLSIRSSFLNTSHNTSTTAFSVPDSESATLAPAVTFEPLLTPAEGARLLGIHAKTLVKMARAELIQAIPDPPVPPDAQRPRSVNEATLCDWKRGQCRQRGNAATEQAMAEASRLVLGGFTLRTDAKIALP